MNKEYKIVPASQAGRYLVRVRIINGARKGKWVTLPTLYSSRYTAEEAIKSL